VTRDPTMEMATVSDIYCMCTNNNAHLLILTCLGNNSYMFRPNIGIIFRESYSHNYTHCHNMVTKIGHNLCIIDCDQLLLPCCDSVCNCDYTTPWIWFLCWLETCRSCFLNMLILINVHKLVSNNSTSKAMHDANIKCNNNAFFWTLHNIAPS
jgi:hypothetical protein